MKRTICEYILCNPNYSSGNRLWFLATHINLLHSICVYVASHSIWSTKEASTSKQLGSPAVALNTFNINFCAWMKKFKQFSIFSFNSNQRVKSPETKQFQPQMSMVPLMDYGRPMKHFFIEIPNFWAWADKLSREILGHFRYFPPNYQYPFWYSEFLVHVFHYSTIISTNKLYPHPK